MTNIQGSVQACPPRHARGTHKPLSSAQSRAQECESPLRVMALKGRGSLEPAGLVTRRGRLALDRPVVHQSLANDTARVVLTRVVLLPVDLIELRPHLF